MVAMKIFDIKGRIDVVPLWLSASAKVLALLTPKDESRRLLSVDVCTSWRKGMWPCNAPQI